MMPICWKCCNKIMLKHTTTREDDTIVGQYYTLAGCKENDKISSYDDALKMCPLNFDQNHTTCE